MDNLVDQTWHSYVFFLVSVSCNRAPAVYGGLPESSPWGPSEADLGYRRLRLGVSATPLPTSNLPAPGKDVSQEYCLKLGLPGVTVHHRYIDPCFHWTEYQSMQTYRGLSNAQSNLSFFFFLVIVFAHNSLCWYNSKTSVSGWRRWHKCKLVDFLSGHSDGMAVSGMSLNQGHRTMLGTRIYNLDLLHRMKTKTPSRATEKRNYSVMWEHYNMYRKKFYLLVPIEAIWVQDCRYWV